MKSAFNLLCFVIAQCVVLSAAWQCEEVRYTPNCAPFNDDNWLEGNCYCSEAEVNGIKTLCCNFQEQRAVLTTNAEEFPYTFTSFTNSSYLDFSVPSRVTTVQIKNISGGGRITLDHKLETWISKLSMKKSTMDFIAPFYRTVLRDCNIKVLDGASRGIQKLTVRNSRIEKLKDFRTVSISRDVCFAMTNSVITTMENFHQICRTVFESSKIGGIVNGIFSLTTFNRMSIDTIYSRGITLTRDLNIFKDTNVTHAHREAIVHHQWADMKLQAVNIENCEYPCFYIYESSRVTLTDFTVNGIPEDDPEKLDLSLRRRVQVPSRKICPRIEAVLLCNLDYNERLECILLKTDFPSILLRSPSNVEIIEGCFNSLHLEEVVGLYHAFSHVPGTRKMNCQKQRSLQLTACEMTTIYSKDVKQIQIERSNVSFLDLNFVTRMVVKHSRLHIIDHLEFIPKNTEDNYFVWFHVGIHIIRKITLNAGARIDFLTVENEITSIVLNHPDERTIVLHSSIHSLPYRSIILTSGELHLTNVKIDSASAGAIYIEDGLLMIETTRDDRIDCSNGPAISAAYRHQVLYIGSSTPDWLWDCTEIREDVHLIEGAVLVEHCREAALFELYCDMVHKPSEGFWGYQLGGSNNALDAYKVVTVVNAPDLTVGRHCFDKISLINTVVSGIQDNDEYTCHYELYLENTTIPQIFNNLLAITILESNVTDQMSPQSHLATLNIDNSIIKSLFVEVSDGTITNSQIKTVVKLNVTNEMIVQSCTVGTVKPLGIISYTNGSLRIIGTTFEGFVFESVRVYGILELYNVSLPVAESGSIYIHPEGKIELTNVNLSNYTVITVKADDNSIQYKNVTVAGKNVWWNGTQFVDEDVQSNEIVRAGRGFVNSTLEFSGPGLAMSSAESNLDPALTTLML